jgi:antitoxin (DNA-binding transcriptional repressor) of toxin-antitoxin stability system
MKALTVGEAKARFSELLTLIMKGESIKILYGKAKKPVALLVPFEEPKGKRKIGLLEGKASFSAVGNGKLTEEEFIGA